MAHAPAVLRAYQELARALKRGVLDVRVREQIALAVAALTGCEYCRVSHTRAAEAMGLSEAEIAAALEGRAGDPRADAAVRLAVAAAGDPHDVDDADVERARSVGLGDGEIAEILAHVALNLFTNTFTIVAGTPVDPPSPADRSRAA
jgi:AhpD family alkylhydroperoxidase